MNRVIGCVAALFLPAAGFGATFPEHRVYDVADELPGSSLLGMALDAEGRAFFVAWEPGPRVLPADTERMASSLAVDPGRRRLAVYDPEADAFHAVSDSFPFFSDFLFDPDGTLWILTPKAVTKRRGETGRVVLDLQADRGLLQAMALDAEGALWVGGLKSGLYRIGPDEAVTPFASPEPLPSDDVTAIHAPDPGTLWIALWYDVGVACLRDGTWTFHDPRSTGAPLQAVWCFETDGDGVLWVGAGNREFPGPLARFDGATWSAVDPPDEDGSPIEGAAVRKLAWDGERLWAVISVGREGQGRIRTFDGHRWSRVSDVPDEATVQHLEVDRIHDTVWIGTVEGAGRTSRLHRIGL